MIYVVAVGYNHEGYGLPEYVGPSLERAQAVINTLAAAGKGNYITLALYNEDGVLVHEEDWI